MTSPVPSPTTISHHHLPPHLQPELYDVVDDFALGDAEWADDANLSRSLNASTATGGSALLDDEVATPEAVSEYWARRVFMSGRCVLGAADVGCVVVRVG